MQALFIVQMCRVSSRLDWPAGRPTGRNHFLFMAGFKSSPTTSQQSVCMSPKSCFDQSVADPPLFTIIIITDRLLFVLRKRVSPTWRRPTTAAAAANCSFYKFINSKLPDTENWLPLGRERRPGRWCKGERCLFCRFSFPYKISNCVTPLHHRRWRLHSSAGLHYCVEVESVPLGLGLYPSSGSVSPTTPSPLPGAQPTAFA